MGRECVFVILADCGSTETRVVENEQVPEASKLEKLAKIPRLKVDK